MLRHLLPTILAMALVMPLTGCPLHPGGTAYFLMADPARPEVGSYVLPLDDPAGIAQARQLIWSGGTSGASIAVATIAPGSSPDYANRDLINEGDLWSWHVTGFEGWAENTIEIYDGTAQYIEDNLEQWMTETGGVLGFWSYRPVREVWPCEVRGSREAGLGACAN